MGKKYLCSSLLGFFSQNYDSLWTYTLHEKEKIKPFCYNLETKNTGKGKQAKYTEVLILLKEEEKH